MVGKRVMKTPWMNLLMCSGILVGSTGCVVSIGKPEVPAHRDEVRKPEPALPPPVVVMPANTEDAATLAEIDAAGSLTFDAGRSEALRRVAARGSLTPPTQVHLVNVALNRMTFDAGKEEVLMVLIRNPAFCPAAKEAIFRQLQRFSFDASKTRIMGEIQARSEGR